MGFNTQQRTDISKTHTIWHKYKKTAAYILIRAAAFISLP